MRTAQLRRLLYTSAVGIALALGTGALLPSQARADHEQPPQFRGVRIDANGVYFDFGRPCYYRVAEFPDARPFFLHNRHYRKARKYERRRRQWLRRVEPALLNGDFAAAESALAHAIHFEKRRLRQLAKLDRDRVRWERRHHRGRWRDQRARRYGRRY